MTVAFGYKLKSCILDDDEIKDYTYESYEKLSELEDKKSYHKKNIDIDVSPLLLNIKTVGEIYHGVSLKIPYTANIYKIKEKLSEIINTELDIDDAIIWIDEMDSEYKIYIECETIVEQAIVEHGDLNYGQAYSDLYTLHKNKK